MVLLASEFELTRRLARGAQRAAEALSWGRELDRLEGAIVRYARGGSDLRRSPVFSGPPDAGPTFLRLGDRAAAVSLDGPRRMRYPGPET